MEFDSFDAYQWRSADGRPIRNALRSIKEVPAGTPVSDSINRDLRRRGFRFVGSTICYAHMQAVGMVMITSWIVSDGGRWAGTPYD